MAYCRQLLLGGPAVVLGFEEQQEKPARAKILEMRGLSDTAGRLQPEYGLETMNLRPWIGLLEVVCRHAYGVPLWLWLNHSGEAWHRDVLTSVLACDVADTVVRPTTRSLVRGRIRGDVQLRAQRRSP